MRTILAFIDAAEGMDALPAHPIRIDPPGPGSMRLSIERIGDGLNGFPLMSVAHYHEQNGDLVADPEMAFEVAPGLKSDREFFPVTFEMPGMGVYRRSTWADAAGRASAAAALAITQPGAQAAMPNRDAIDNFIRSRSA